MNELNYYNPTRIVSGLGCVRAYDGFAALGKRAILVCGRQSARISGALDHVRLALDAAEIRYTIFDRVENNPTVETCLDAGREAREFGAEFVIGIGGGSPLDAAKAVAVFAKNPTLTCETIYRHTFTEALPIVAIPTTAGTGSEVTQYAVLTVRAAETKQTVKHPLLFPRVALLDAAYTETLSHRVTISTAVDAISHSVEGFFAKRANAVTDALAVRSLRLLSGGLHSILAGTLDLEVREMLLYGSTLAGMVIAGTGTGFVHTLGYALTYFDGVPHGEANAYFLSDFVAYMSLAREDKERVVYQALGVRDAHELRAWIETLIPLELKLSRDRVMQYSHSAEKRLATQNSVYEITNDDIYDLYKQYMR